MFQVSARICSPKFCCTPSFYRPITGCTSNYVTCFENVENKYSRTPLIRPLVIQIANFRIGLALRVNLSRIP